jgi:hypothetical protein
MGLLLLVGLALPQTQSTPLQVNAHHSDGYTDRVAAESR